MHRKPRTINDGRKRKSSGEDGGSTISFSVTVKESQNKQALRKILRDQRHKETGKCLATPTPTPVRQGTSNGSGLISLAALMRTDWNS